MRAIVTLLMFVTALVATPACAPSPSNYEDCILESMKGGMSNYAAGLIQTACRNKFPVGHGETQISKDELAQIELSSVQFGNTIPVAEHSPAAVRAAQEKGADSLTFTARNNSETLTVTQLTIHIMGDDLWPAGAYTVSCNIKPHASERIAVEIAPIPNIRSWGLGGARATRR